jgi:hypothetical protein
MVNRLVTFSLWIATMIVVTNGLHDSLWFDPNQMIWIGTMAVISNIFMYLELAQSKLKPFFLIILLLYFIVNTVCIVGQG